MDRDLPPVIQIVLDEQLSRFSSSRELAAKIAASDLDKELQRQALWSAEQFAYDANAAAGLPVGFSVAPSISLNPFASTAKCGSTACRAKSNEDFVKTVGLYTDVAFLPDPLTPMLVQNGVKASHSKEFYEAVKTLQYIMPLVQAGVIRFITPFHHYCRQCHRRITDSVDRATDSLLIDIQSDIHAEIFKEKKVIHVFIRTPLLYPASDHPLVWHVPLRGASMKEFTRICGTGSRPKQTQACRIHLAELIRKRLRGELLQVLFDVKASREMKALMLAGSRVEPLFLSRLERSAPAVDELEHWESLRTLHLPWIHELSVEEVLRLREEAHLALPRLREMLDRRLNTPVHDSAEKVRETISELREQAAEVEAELGGLELGKERNYRAGMGGLAMLFVVYAVASGVPQLQAGGIGALLATLAHLRSTERAQAAELAKLASKPAFALFKAKRIIESRKVKT
jgi:hypothetical protein